ncbi:hypothetical protein IQ249_25175 [Lusitaniella coriacea LEGE 07157]|uniref:Uncharacterized protein n=1 Tax=Lusitaniella coriacea LEGE 07157 TaxID=945747 RepID=A0A8J7E125_9CYAN|nr:hypothetical protein [Lusitaniella coriacea]MBE9119150.1 hypothetical protein [Lusitaniella coriacea LEGE 07157]
MANSPEQPKSDSLQQSPTPAPSSKKVSNPPPPIPPKPPTSPTSAVKTPSPSKGSVWMSLINRAIAVGIAVYGLVAVWSLLQ